MGPSAQGLPDVPTNTPPPNTIRPTRMIRKKYSSRHHSIIHRTVLQFTPKPTNNLTYYPGQHPSPTHPTQSPYPSTKPNCKIIHLLVEIEPVLCFSVKEVLHLTPKKRRI
jgi:hypothetical protein